MAGIGEGVVTLTDYAKRLDPDNKVSAIIELLAQTNDILTDMLWAEGNLPTGHRTTVRTGLPTVTWRLLNAGVAPSKSRTAQVDEACAKLEAWSEVDVALAKLSNNVSAFRLSEASAFIEAMNQEFSSTLFYGDSTTAPEEFTGLAPRFASTTATSGQNVVSGSGSGSDNSSIWLICWGENTLTGIYPKGSAAGLSHNDLGEETVETTAGIGGNRMRAFRDQWIWDCGIALKDWRYVVRGCNIDISNLVAKSSAADLIDLMIKMTHRLPNQKMGRCAFYMNRTCFEMLDIQRRDDAVSGAIKYSEIDGVIRPFFRNVPIGICDSLLETEATVS
jgi:hypothetical protein